MQKRTSSINWHNYVFGSVFDENPAVFEHYFTPQKSLIWNLWLIHVKGSMKAAIIVEKIEGRLNDFGNIFGSSYYLPND